MILLERQWLSNKKLICCCKCDIYLINNINDILIVNHCNKKKRICLITNQQLSFIPVNELSYKSLFVPGLNKLLLRMSSNDIKNYESNNSFTFLCLLRCFRQICSNLRLLHESEQDFQSDEFYDGIYDPTNEDSSLYHCLARCPS